MSVGDEQIFPSNSEVTGVNVDAIPTSDLSEKQQRIVAYLLHCLRDGEQYTRSKAIADETNLSAKEVGTNISKIRKKVDCFSIEEWGRSKSVTWYISSG